MKLNKKTLMISAIIDLSVGVLTIIFGGNIIAITAFLTSALISSNISAAIEE